MNKKKKTILSSLILLTLASGALLAFSLSDSHAYQEGVIDVALTWGDDNDALQGFFDRYMDAGGMPVAADSRLREKDLKKMISGDNPPDVIILSTGELVGELASLGDLALLDPMVQDQGLDLEDFYPAATAQCRDSQGTLLCLPWGIDAYALYWNKALFAEAGLDPNQPPETMEEMVTVAAQLTEFNQDRGEFERMGFLPDFPRSYLDQYAHIFGSESRSGADFGSLTSAAAALEWEKEFFQAYDQEAVDSFMAQINHYRNSGHPTFAGRRVNCQQCHRTSPGNAAKMPDHAFYDGKIAMMVDGQWQDGDSYLGAFAPDLDYGVVPLPIPAGQDEFQGSSLIQGPVILLTGQGPDAEAAADFISWLLSPPVQIEAASRFGFLPSRISAAVSPDFAGCQNTDVFLGILSNPRTTFSEPLPGGGEN